MTLKDEIPSQSIIKADTLFSALKFTTRKFGKIQYQMKENYSKYMEVSWAQRFLAGLGRYLPNLFCL